MKNKKTFVRWLSLFLLIVAVVGITVVSADEPTPKAATGIVLEDMAIVLPANATDVETSAAKELKYYLKEITGNEPAVRTEGVNIANAIYIGATKYAEANGVTLEAGAFTDNNGIGEGWVIKEVDGNLVINGGTLRGSLYGVYHLLEDQLGVRWWNEWEEYVPTMEDAVIPYGFEDHGEPALAERNVFGGWEWLTTMWNVRNRANGYGVNTPIEYGGDEEFGAPYPVHTVGMYYKPFYMDQPAQYAEWEDLMNPDGISYFVEHPEWFSWSEGEQKRIASGQLCLSNPDLIADWTQKVLDTIEYSYKDHARRNINPPRYFNLSLNDTGGNCECAECKAIIEKHGDCGLMIWAFNQIADAVWEAGYTDVIIDTLAYANYLEPPTGGLEPAKNLRVRLADSAMDVLQDVNHPNNADVYRRIEEWGDYMPEGNLGYWAYGTCYDVHGVFPSMFNYQPLLQHLYENGGRGMFYEMEDHNNLDFWDLKAWMIVKLMEDPYLDETALIMDFLTGYYGEAAAQDLFDYLVYMRSKSEQHKPMMQFLETVLDAKWLNGKDVYHGHLLFESATSKTQNNPDLTDAEKELFIHRIDAARAGLDRVILENYAKYVNEMGNDEDTTTFFDIDRNVAGRRMANALAWLMELEVSDHTGYVTVPKRGYIGGGYDSTPYIAAQYAEYVDETDPDFDTVNRVPDIPEQIYIDHPGISDKHIYNYTAESFYMYSDWYDYLSLEYGAASFENGYAAKLDYGKAVEVCNRIGTTDRLSEYFTISETVPLESTIPGLYLNNPVIADGEYHLYRIKDVAPIPSNTMNINFFGWTAMDLQLPKLTHLADQKMDVYLSMKIVGDPTGTDPKNYASYYIDRVILVEPCTVYDMEMEFNEEATCASNATMIGVCPACGQDVISDVEGTRLAHTFVGDYTYNEQTGCYEGYCSVCDDVVSIDNLLGKLPQETIEEMTADGVGLDRVLDFDVKDFYVETSGTYGQYTSVVNDSKSAVSRAVKWDLDNVPNSMLGYFTVTDEISMDMTNRIRKATPLFAKDLYLDNEYHMYKLEDVELVGHPEGSFLYFFDWSLQVYFDHLTHLTGKKVDVYFSMRIDGDLNFGVSGNRPDYYIDRILIVDACPSHVADSYTFDPATGLYTGTCNSCRLPVELDDIAGELPAELLASGTNLIHYFDYSAAGFSYNYGAVSEADAAAFMGTAARFDSFDLPMEITTNTGTVLGTISEEQFSENLGKGYVLYKVEDVQLPEDGYGAICLVTNGMRCMEIANDLSDLSGETIDLYVSVKMDSLTGPAYIDRMIAATSCGNYLNEKFAKVKDAAGCTTGTIMQGTCTLCGSAAVKELNDALGHDIPTEYTFNETTGKYELVCARNCGFAIASDNVDGELPEELYEELTAAGVSMKHVYDYDVDDFTLIAAQGVTKVADSDSALGYAAKADKVTVPMQISPDKGTFFTRLTKAQLEPNVGKGYCLYKVEDIQLVRNANFKYLTMWKNGLQNHKMATDLKHLQGKKVDLYLSIKMDSITGPAYLDRMVVVDTCQNHIADADYKQIGEVTCEGGKEAAECPICGLTATRDLPAVPCKFEEYIQEGFGEPDVYYAECIYGCGATDKKVDRPRSDDELLPAELSYLKPHLVGIYNARDLHVTGEQRRLWDMSVDRPVIERDRAREFANINQQSLNMSIATHIEVSLYSNSGQTNIGNIPGTEIIANANKGWKIYSIKGAIPIVYQTYNLFYMFNDWEVQCMGLDDDLVQDYRGESLDFYFRIKVEGDPSCQNLNDQPRYYIDQVIVTTSCQGDNWEIVKEPTCSETGLQRGDCKICGATNVEVGIPKTEHTITDGKIRTQATCIEDLIVEGQCAVCGKSQTSARVAGTMLEHEYGEFSEDEYGRLVAYCIHGCNKRIFKEDQKIDTPDLSETEKNMLDALAISGGAAGGKVFSFRDVNETDWFYDEVRSAWENDLINGVTPTEFRPNETLTVAQAIKLAAALHQMYYTGEVTLTNGVANWYDTYVAYAVNNGIVDSSVAGWGMDKMNSAINRSDFVAIFSKSMEAACFEGWNEVADNAIPDVKLTDKNGEAIYSFYRAGILTGSDGAGTFNPASSIKRSEVAAILIRMYDTNARQSITLS